MDTTIHTPNILLDNLAGVIYIPGDTRSNVGIYIAIAIANTEWNAIGRIDIGSCVGEFGLCPDYGGHDIFSH